jgi:hypothetical protein
MRPDASHPCDTLTSSQKLSCSEPHFRSHSARPLTTHVVRRAETSLGTGIVVARARREMALSSIRTRKYAAVRCRGGILIMQLG